MILHTYEIWSDLSQLEYTLCEEGQHLDERDDEGNAFILLKTFTSIPSEASHIFNDIMMQRFVTGKLYED